MGRRKPGKYADYTPGEDRRFADRGVGGTLRVLHGPEQGMGITEGVVCRVEVLGQDGALLAEAEAGKLGKEHRLRATAPGDRVDVTVSASYASDGELNATRTVVLTGDLDDMVCFGVGPGWEQVARRGRRGAALATDRSDVSPLGCRVWLRGGTAGIRALNVRSVDP